MAAQQLLGGTRPGRLKLVHAILVFIYVQVRYPMFIVLIAEVGRAIYSGTFDSMQRHVLGPTSNLRLPKLAFKDTGVSDDTYRPFRVSGPTADLFWLPDRLCATQTGRDAYPILWQVRHR